MKSSPRFDAKVAQPYSYPGRLSVTRNTQHGKIGSKKVGLPLATEQPQTTQQLQGFNQTLALV
jgi:hypothetical protein